MMQRSSCARPGQAEPLPFREVMVARAAGRTVAGGPEQGHGSPIGSFAARERTGKARRQAQPPSLGAARRDVVGLIVREGMSLAVAGLAIGLLFAAAGTRLIASLLVQVSPLDWTTFAGMSALLLAVSLAACYLPARRAAAVDPIAALRPE